MIQLIMQKVHILPIVHVWIAMRDALGVWRPDQLVDLDRHPKIPVIDQRAVYLTGQLYLDRHPEFPVKTCQQEKLDGYCF